MHTWEELRSNWVNGNLEDTREKLYQMPKIRIFKIIAEALEEHFEHFDPKNRTWSGDLQDLREILRSIYQVKS